MNDYYHAFHVGFNFYFLFVAISFVAVILIGLSQYKEGKKGIRRRFTNNVFTVFAVIDTVIFTVMFVKESVRGLVQFFDNGLSPSESPMWSILVLPMVIAIIAFIYGGLIYYVGRFVASFKLATLKEKHTRNFP